MEYKNPIINSDYSDPDVIYHKGSYYLVSSSFTSTPGLPILKSKNLVDWKILRYVYKNLPFDKYDRVLHGRGAWAPSIRYHNNMFYIIVPFYGDGIYIYRTDDIESGEFVVNKLIDNPGVIDPCPIWVYDKCYLVVGFAKSKCGFNSVLGLYEVSADLYNNISGDYKIIFDGHDTQPTIEGPKFYYKNKYFYILAPAGSVKSGWQVALRSKNIYGPYEQKIVLLSNDRLDINGPHQGGMVKAGKKDAFIHFQDKGPFGRVCHLEPITWHDNWPLMGDVKDLSLAGSPCYSHEYLINKKSNYKIQVQDNFKSDKLSLMWQCPANIKDNWYSFDSGMILNHTYYKEALGHLDLLPNSFLTKLYYSDFKVKCKFEFEFIDSNSEFGIVLMGSNFASLKLVKKDDGIHIVLFKGSFLEEEEIIKDILYDKNSIVLTIRYFKDNTYQLGYNNTYFSDIFIATPGRWIGAKYGFYRRGISSFSQNMVKVKYFKVVDYASK